MENNALFNYHYNFSSDQLLVALHGLFGSSDDFEFLSEHFPSYSVLCIDLPGHGKTPITGSDTLVSTAHNLVSLITHFRKSKVHLLGYSMGGRIAMHMVDAYPTYFSSLILEAAHPGIDTRHDAVARLHADYTLSDRLEDGEAFFKQWYDQPLFYRYNTTRSYEASIQKKIVHPYTLYQAALRQFSVGHQSHLSSVFDLPIPISYLYGEYDLKYKQVAETLPIDKKSIYEISHSGHNCHSENQIEFISSIKTHLRRIS